MNEHINLFKFFWTRLIYILTKVGILRCEFHTKEFSIDEDVLTKIAQRRNDLRKKSRILVRQSWKSKHGKTDRQL